MDISLDLDLHEWSYGLGGGEGEIGVRVKGSKATSHLDKQCLQLLAANEMRGNQSIPSKKKVFKYRPFAKNVILSNVSEAKD